MIMSRSDSDHKVFGSEILVRVSESDLKRSYDTK